MPKPVDLLVGHKIRGLRTRDNASRGERDAGAGSNNDNFEHEALLTRQGFAMAKAFHSIADLKVRAQLLQLVQSVAHQEVRASELNRELLDER